MRTTFISMLLLLWAAAVLNAQDTDKNPWSFTTEERLTDKAPFRQIIPLAYQVLHLDVNNMQSSLDMAPLWQTPEADVKDIHIELPMPDGSFQTFRVEEAPVMHPDLAALFPEIKSYAGVGIDDPTAYLRFDMTPRGFHAMVLTAQSSTVFIDPYSTADNEYYISYYKKDFRKDEPFDCLFDEVNPTQKSSKPILSRLAGDCQLRTYTLALACTGEYATFHGGTTAAALAAMNTTMVRVNGVFENECSIHMDLHPNTSALIFLNPSTDPYTNGNGSAMLGENQTTCDNVIGNANYDIGHVFSTGGGGVAYLKAVCSNSIKAGGVTGSGSPVGDPFDIDYVAHEMGHQYGANHTQNNSCNRNNATAMEPGSASTIMGYAGICAPNVQNNSDDYFHAISIQEIAAEVTSNGSGGGNTCSTNSTINGAPTANAGSNYTIPKSTPFVLTGTGTDPNGDPITYTWEQMDNQVATMPPQSTNTGGPAFRSFKGTSSPSRYLPRLTDLVNNVSPTWEVLSSVGRTYNWRLTVKDNHIGGGCTAEDDMTVTVSSSSGPFVVTSPNTAVTWPALSTQLVTWSVANTTAAPVSCANVDILLSVDGGFTYPLTLATGTANDGSHTVTIPNNQTTQARIMVRGNGNIFFDISNENFTIGTPQNSFSLAVSPKTQAVCAPADAIYDVNVGVIGNFSGNVTLSASGNPFGSTVSFSTNPVAVPGSSEMTVGNLGSVAPGSYTMIVTGISGADVHTDTVMLTVANGLPASVSLTSPANGATGISLTPQLTWTPQSGVDSYELEVASDPAFANLVVQQTGITDPFYQVMSALNLNTTYHWRVKGENACGAGNFSAPFSFTTENLVCNTFVSTDVPKTISSSGTPTVTSTLSVGVSGNITDLNVLNLDIDHTYINDLVVKLKSPANTEQTLLNRICGSQNNILLDLDDESANPYNSIPCPPNGGVYKPYQVLSAFDTQDLSGTWTLTINDVANQDGGSLQAWSLNICYVPIPPLTLSVSSTNVTCHGAANGTAAANPAGGTGVYSYNWTNGSSSQSVSGLAPGPYTVTVTSGSAQVSGTVSITEPIAIDISVPTLTQPTCQTSTGTIVVNATGPGPLEYSVDGGGDWQSSNTFSNLVPGNYDIMVRLDSDPSCSVTYTGNPVTINPVPTPPVVTAPDIIQPTCAIPTGTITVNATGGGPLQYSINGGQNWQGGKKFNFLSAGDYMIHVRLQSDPTCETVYAGNPVTISPAPTAPVVSTPDVIQPTCALPTGTITVNATGGGTLEYSVDEGLNWQPGSVFSSLSVGDYDILVRLQSDPTCETAYSGNPVTISPAPTAPVVSIPDVTQPTCALPTGTITVNATGSGTLEYSIDNGLNWQSGSGFSSLSAGDYDILVRLQSDPTCETAYSGNPETIDPAPTAPVVSIPDVTQPTCALPTGTITVNATGSGTLEYSIDNGLNWQSGSGFSSLSAGDYDILVRLQSDPTCETAYSGNPVMISPAPTAPVVSTLDVTQPTCALPTGAITVNATGGGTLEYSIDNGLSWQSGSGFSSLSAGDYDILVRLQSDPTCETAYSGNPVMISPAPTAPLVNTPDVTQPTCALPTGTITVNATGGGTLEYSIDNGLNWQSGSGFSSVSAGDYDILVRLQSDPTCETAYSSNPVTIDPAPTAPVVSIPDVTQPTCALPTGTITVNATGSGTLEYSIDNGLNWQSGSGFSSLSAGDYDILVRLQSDPTCETAYSGNPVTIDPAPTAPVVSIPDVTQPTCALPTGTITVNATGGGTLEYSIDNGLNWQSGSGFSSLSAGDYDILVRLQSDPTCETAYSGNPVTIDPAPTAPVVNPPDVTQPTCALSTGTIIVNATGGGTLEYSIDGGLNWQVSSVFEGLDTGSYSIAVRLQSDPVCEASYAGNPVSLVQATGCCPTTLAVDDTPIVSGVYQASALITSNAGLVPNMGNVIFDSGGSVELNANFEVELGAVFEVLLVGCTP